MLKAETTVTTLTIIDNWQCTEKKKLEVPIQDRLFTLYIYSKCVYIYSLVHATFSDGTISSIASSASSSVPPSPSVSFIWSCCSMLLSYCCCWNRVTSIIALNVNGSVAANSDRTLRFNWISAYCNERMKRLYRTEYCLTPAWIRWIQRVRQIRFFVLRSRYAYCQAFCNRRIAMEKQFLLRPRYPFVYFSVLWCCVEWETNTVMVARRNKCHVRRYLLVASVWEYTQLPNTEPQKTRASEAWNSN